VSDADRGVTEVLGFVLVFALVLSTVSLVFVTGIGGVEDARDAERVNNAERAFDVLEDNFGDVYRRGAPSRKTEIKLADASLALTEPTSFSVTVNDVEDASGNDLVFGATSRPIVFTAEARPGTKVVYEAGAVLRSDRGAAIMLDDPPFALSEERTVLQYVALSGEAGSIGGSSTVLVRGDRTGRSVLVEDTDNDVEVTLTIETTDTRAPVWRAYVNEQVTWSGADWQDGDATPCDTTNSLAGDRTEIVCTFEPDSFYLTSTGIETELVQ
jgi:hypothetical protein